MIAVLTFCHKDYPQALKQAKWISEMGGVSKHSAIVACNRMSWHQKYHLRVIEALRGCFSHIDSFVPFSEEESGWPLSPNHMWIAIAQEMDWVRGGKPFLWMETDAIPTAEHWLDSIESGYQDSGKDYMGDLVQIEGVSPHMSGVAVYRHITTRCENYAIGAITKEGKPLAFDVANASSIFRSYSQTHLIHHDWKPEKVTLDRVRPGAVIYHQDKTGTLIDQLRLKSRGGVIEVTHPAVIDGKTAGASPAPATVPRKKHVRMKQKKTLTPEHLAKLQAGMAKAREAKRQKAMA